MKKIFAFLILATSAIQCSDLCTVTNTYYYSIPEYMSFEDLRASVKSEAPKDLVHAGKIYFKDNFLYVNELGKGIHVIDNHDPSNPVHRSFINIPGNVDIAIFGNTLYADSFVDLVAIDVTTPGQEREIARYNDMFSMYASNSLGADPDKGVIVSLSVGREMEIRHSCTEAWISNGYRNYEDGMLMNAQTYTAATKSSAAPSNILPGNSSGVAGSMARFAIKSEYLYVLDIANIKVIDLTNPTIDIKNSVPISSGVETIFPYNDNLFLGTTTGMQIFSISEPSDPKYLTSFAHIKSCDPVVVEGKYAYVTLRSGNTCGGAINELQIVDISKITEPRAAGTFAMSNPHGLGIDNGLLFICDGSAGLKIYDATNIPKIPDNLKAQYKDIQAFDIIPFNKVAMMIGEDGLYQYDYSDIENIRLLSKIDIKAKE